MRKLRELKYRDSLLSVVSRPHQEAECTYIRFVLDRHVKCAFGLLALITRSVQGCSYVVAEGIEG